MPKINCLATAKKTYQQDVETDDITAVYDKLSQYADNLRKNSTDILGELNNAGKTLVDQHEFNSKVAMYQAARKGQVIVDALQREALFRAAGHKEGKSFIRSLKARLYGSGYKVERAGDNTWARQMDATNAFYNELDRDLTASGLWPLFRSDDAQVEIANALFAEKSGKPLDNAYGKLARILIKYQDRAVGKLNEVGVFFNKLADRIAPNVHDKIKMMDLSWKEQRRARIEYAGDNNPIYEYAYQRWNQFIYPLLDKKKTFISRGIDYADAAQVDSFMREAFESLVNKGKVSQEKVNYSSKFNQQRVLHFADGESLVNYNKRFGSESIQMSMLRELANQFSMTEVMRDWSVNPKDALSAIFEVADKNPEINKRFNKDKEYKALARVLDTMTNAQYSDPNAVSTMVSSILSWEAVTKLGDALAPSTTDLANVAHAAKKVGIGRMRAWGTVVRLFITGIPKGDRMAVANMVDSANSVKLGNFNRFYVNPFNKKSLPTLGVHYIYKFSGLERLDRTNRFYLASITGQFMANKRGVSWDAFSEKEKGLFARYGINESDWNLIRQSSERVGDSNTRYIMPDSVQNIDDNSVRESLIQRGMDDPSDANIQAEKDSIERKMVTMYREIQNTGVITVSPAERAFTEGLLPQNWILREIMRFGLQFHHFGFASVRQGLLPRFLENGATTLAEAINPVYGKSNWLGIGDYAANLMVLGYAGMVLKNIAQGKSPPGLDKLDTWGKLAKNALGAVATMFEFNFKDPYRSVGSLFGGATLSDVEKLTRLGYNAASEYKEGFGYDKTKKSAYQFVKSNVPFNNIFTRWIVNHFALNSLEDWAAPGKRQNDLDKLQQTTGAKQIF